MKIFCLNNNTGARFYRLIPQLKEMQRQGHEVIIESHDAEHIMEKIDWSDLIIFQMVFSPELTRYAKKKGKKVVFECDDLIHAVPKDHYAYKEVAGIRNKIKWFWRIWRTIGQSDGFISTCKNLNRIYGWLARKSLVFPNFLDLSHWLKEYKPNTTDRIRILWAGSTSHKPDLKAIKPVLKRILDKYPQVQFIYIGYGGIKSVDLQAKFIYGEDIFEGLPDNRESMLPAPANIFPYALAVLQADIAIAPLNKNYFNKFKSTCKFLEYSINRIPSVYAGWHYKQIVKHGETGFLANNDDEWFSYLSDLIESKELRDIIKENAYQEVLKNHDIRNHIINWQGFIEGL